MRLRGGEGRGGGVYICERDKMRVCVREIVTEKNGEIESARERQQERARERTSARKSETERGKERGKSHACNKEK